MGTKSLCLFFVRYLFSLQMKRDLMEGRLVCTENTGALLASHLVQCKFMLLFLIPKFCLFPQQYSVNMLSQINAVLSMTAFDHYT